MLKLFSRSNDTDSLSGIQDELGQLELPTFPQVTLSALEKARDHDGAASELADVLATDPGLTVRIISTVNSAAFGCRSEVRNIHHAVSLLGRNEIETMLISVAVRQALPRTSVSGFDPRRFWYASAKRASAARGLALRVDPSKASESFTAALLQDMAVPLLAHQLGDRYTAVLEAWHDGDRDLAELEQEEFGWDHATLGAWIGREWKFPTVLADAIGAHHGSTEGEPTALGSVSSVSCLRETHEEVGDQRFIETLEAEHGITPEETTELLEQSASDAHEVAALFG